MISRVCQEFGCLPSQAIREMEETPAGLLWTVLEMRAYARAKAELEQAQTDDSEIEMTEMHDVVEEIREEADARIASIVLRDRRRDKEKASGAE